MSFRPQDLKLDSPASAFASLARGTRHRFSPCVVLLLAVGSVLLGQSEQTGVSVVVGVQLWGMYVWAEMREQHHLQPSAQAACALAKSGLASNEALPELECWHIF